MTWNHKPCLSTSKGSTRSRALAWHINSTRPNDAYLRQLRIIAFRRFEAKPLSQPMLIYCHLNSYKQISVTYKSKHYTCFYKNGYDHVVCEVAAIPSRSQYLSPTGDTPWKNCGLRMHRKCRERFTCRCDERSRHSSRHVCNARAVMHAVISN